MANTKYILFHGFIKPEKKDQFTKESLSKSCNASEVLVDISIEPFDNEIKVMGMIYTFSSSGKRIISHLSDNFSTGSFFYSDIDYEEYEYYTVYEVDGKKQTKKYLMRPEEFPLDPKKSTNFSE